WGYALETAAYLLNLVPSKSVEKTPFELWFGRKPSLSHIRIWGSPAHVLNKKADKLEARSDARLFIGYPRGTKGGLFYSPKDQKVIISTNARFLEEDYMKNHKSKVEIILQELEDDRIPPPIRPKVRDVESSGRDRHQILQEIEVGRVPLEIPTVQVVPTQQVVQDREPQVSAPTVAIVPVEPRRSGRVVRQPERFMFVGESSDLVPADEHAIIDPWTYKEAIQDIDARSIPRENARPVARSPRDRPSDRETRSRETTQRQPRTLFFPSFRSSFFRLRSSFTDKIYIKKSNLTTDFLVV
ncbi:hypothetical protein, partial [Escherichia coli]|uniref:hypothetical protein n=1 Tax=Escherichia coli TaxID=562 RepID=UPI003079ADE2